jgi:hypothetical protein
MSCLGTRLCISASDRLPSAHKVPKLYHHPNSWFMRSAGLGSEGSSRGPVELARSLIGCSTHLWMWDESSLAAAFDKTGFANIRRCRFGDCKDGKFRLVEDAGRFYDANDGVEECGMEVMKPEGIRDMSTFGI